MKKVLYAEILIKAKASNKEIDERELELSDALYEIIDELEAWLKKKAASTELSFEVFY